MAFSAAALSLSRVVDALQDSPPEQRQSQRSVSPILVHNSAPSSHPQCVTETDMHSTGPIGRNTRVLSKDEIAKRLSRALTEAAPSAKHVARAVQASADTAEGWRAGNIPTGFNMIALGQHFPMYGLEVAALMGLDIDQSRDYALFLAFQRQMMERLK